MAMHRRYLSLMPEGLDGPEFYVAIDKLKNEGVWLSIHMECGGVVRDQRIPIVCVIDVLREMGWACFES